MRLHPTLRCVAAIALAAVAVSAAQPSRADDFYPGLPDSDGSTYPSFSNAAQGAITYATRAKQWFRSPEGLVTITSGLGADDRVGDTKHLWTDSRVFFVSSEGAPENYGYLAPMTVRSVGFGLMPVEATVQVSQRRDGPYPVPISFRLDVVKHYSPGLPGHPDFVDAETQPEAVVEDSFNVQILAVKIDGVDLGLGDTCRTETPAPARLVAPEYTIPLPDRPTSDPTKYDSYKEEWYRAQDPTTYFHPFYGGQLSGTITIPPFTGCTTAAGDDLSDLMTLSVSGPGNPMFARAGWACDITRQGMGWPAAPGQTYPKEIGCEDSEQFAYPERPADPPARRPRSSSAPDLSPR